MAITFDNCVSRPDGRLAKVWRLASGRSRVGEDLISGFGIETSEFEIVFYLSIHWLYLTSVDIPDLNYSFTNYLDYRWLKSSITVLLLWNLIQFIRTQYCIPNIINDNIWFRYKFSLTAYKHILISVYKTKPWNLHIMVPKVKQELIYLYYLSTLIAASRLINSFILPVLRVLRVLLVLLVLQRSPSRHEWFWGNRWWCTWSSEYITSG